MPKIVNDGLENLALCYVLKKIKGLEIDFCSILKNS